MKGIIRIVRIAGNLLQDYPSIVLLSAIPTEVLIIFCPTSMLALRANTLDFVLSFGLNHTYFLSHFKMHPARLDRKGPRRAISSPLAYPDRVSGTSAARYIVYRRVKIKDWPDRIRTDLADVAIDKP